MSVPRDLPGRQKTGLILQTMQLIPLDIFALWGIRHPVSGLSHLLGMLLGVMALIALVRQAQRRGLPSADVWRLAIYGVSLVLVFTASALYHLCSGPPERIVLLQKLDHAAIFLMIAGTNTAFCGGFKGWAGASCVATWIVALGALVLKLVVWPMTSWLSVLVYLTVGWVAAPGFFELVRVEGWPRLRLAMGGMIVYLIGAVVFATEWPVLWPGFIEGHELFHGLVLVGAAGHFAFVYRYGTRPRTSPGSAPAFTGILPRARYHPESIYRAG